MSITTIVVGGLCFALGYMLRALRAHAPHKRETKQLRSLFSDFQDLIPRKPHW